MMVPFFQRTVVCDVFLIVVWISHLLEVAADHRRRLVMLSHSDGLIALATRGYENIAAHEIHEVRTLEEQLRHPCIVVVSTRDMAIRAAFGFFPSYRVRDKRAECLSTEPFRGDGLLLIVEPVAIIVLRTNHHRARGTHRRHS